MTTTVSRQMSWMVVLGLVVIGSAWCASTIPPDEGPARYPVTLSDESELLRVVAAGLAGDAFGYDANEVLYQVRAAGMPTADIVPTFYIAHLSGKSFEQVIELRAKGTAWGQVATDLGIDAATLNQMALPRTVQFTDQAAVPDDVLQDMFACSALSHVYKLDPDEVFGYYQDGWSALDVMVAAQLGYRSDRPLRSFLEGSPHRVDWLAAARDAGVDLRAVARASGRCFDNRVPVVGQEGERADLQTLYAVDTVREHWSVPIETVRYARYRYLYSPPELLQVFYVSDLAGCDYWAVSRAYAWTHGRHWGRTLIGLHVPHARLQVLPIWGAGPIDLYGVDIFMLNNALLSCALTFGSPLHASFIYTHFDPWFGPGDAILFWGSYHRHHVPFDDYYRWCRSGRPWHHYEHFDRDRGQLRRDMDWADNRRVGVVLGDRRPQQEPRVAGPTARNAGFRDGRYRPGTTAGAIVGERATEHRGAMDVSGSYRRGTAAEPGDLRTPQNTPGAVTGQKSSENRAATTLTPRYQTGTVPGTVGLPGSVLGSRTAASGTAPLPGSVLGARTAGASSAPLPGSVIGGGPVSESRYDSGRSQPYTVRDQGTPTPVTRHQTSVGAIAGSGVASERSSGSPGGAAPTVVYRATPGLTIGSPATSAPRATTSTFNYQPPGTGLVYGSRSQPPSTTYMPTAPPRTYSAPSAPSAPARTYSAPSAPARTYSAPSAPRQGEVSGGSRPRR